MTEYRAEFDADVTFLNGGGLQAQGFKLDVPDPEITEDQLRTYYDENITQFEQPEARDVRVILTKNEADAEEAAAALAEDSSPQSFKEVAKEFSIDEATQSTGGLREAVFQGQS